MTLEANDLLLFARVADAGSFSRAAESLRLPKSTVSRRVAALESQLGERLLLRTTRKLHVTDFGRSVRGGSMDRFLNPRGHAIVAALHDVGARLHATPAQVALAWLMARPGVTAPIASATSVAQLEELLGALRLALDADAVRRLDAAGA